jgi:hypothetical protein
MLVWTCPKKGERWVVYLLLNLSGDWRVSGVRNTLAAFVLHVDECGGVVVVWVEDVKSELMSKRSVQAVAHSCIIAIRAPDRELEQSGRSSQSSKVMTFGGVIIEGS